MIPELEPGITGFLTTVVTPDKLALVYGSGTLAVLATPAMIALMEQTAMKSVALLVPEGYSTVGTQVNIKHFRPTQQGEEIQIETELVKVEDRKLIFNVLATCRGQLIGKGIHKRYIIDNELFVRNLKTDQSS